MTPFETVSVGRVAACRRITELRWSVRTANVAMVGSIADDQMPIGESWRGSACARHERRGETDL
jgi:hypothetical protein